MLTSFTSWMLADVDFFFFCWLQSVTAVDALAMQQLSMQQQQQRPLMSVTGFAVATRGAYTRKAGEECYSRHREQTDTHTHQTHTHWVGGQRFFVLQWQNIQRTMCSLYTLSEPHTSVISPVNSPTHMNGCNNTATPAPTADSACMHSATYLHLLTK